MTVLITRLRLRLWRAFLGRALITALTRNDRARQNLDNAIRETLQR
ncbi:MAG: hypothetical protein KJO30_12810 [Boseongicola sp.]|nr:hypothetical protein [Boseongicola sp.]NNJ69547.1 hypothetical protein [Boseongicola sp.]